MDAIKSVGGGNDGEPAGRFRRRVAAQGVLSDEAVDLGVSRYGAGCVRKDGYTFGEVDRGGNGIKKNGWA